MELNDLQNLKDLKEILRKILAFTPKNDQQCKSMVQTTLVSVTEVLSISEMYFLPFDLEIFNVIQIKGMKSIKITQTRAQELPEFPTLDLVPCVFQRITTDGQDWGYILLSTENAKFGIIKIAMADSNNDRLTATVIDHLELIALSLTSMFYQCTHFTPLARQYSDNSLRDLLDKHQRTIAKDLIEGIAHGVANPLAVILANQEILEEYITTINSLIDDGNFEHLPIINDELHHLFMDQRSAIVRMNQLLGDLRSYSQGTKYNRNTVILNNAIQQGVNLSQLRADLRSRIKLNLHANDEVQASPFGISQAVFHILKFLAERSTSPTETITISTKDVHHTSGKSAQIKLETKVVEFEGDEANIDLTLATHYVKGYGGTITHNSKGKQLVVIMKLQSLNEKEAVKIKKNNSSSSH
ncbi:MAG: hypothetical protein ACXAB7_15165 [Candidatus Kariarchaeaceae archaeon]